MHHIGPPMHADEPEASELPPQAHSVEMAHICPCLGLADDPETRAAYPRTDHICTLPGAAALTLGWQRSFCLSSQHTACCYFQDGAWPRARSSRSSARRRWIAPIVGAGCVALAASALYVDRQGNTDNAAAASPTAPVATVVVVAVNPATPTATATPRLLATFTPTARTAPPPLAPSATATSTPPPTPVPTVVATPTAVVAPPTATPATPQVYVVVAGDTIEIIAARFGVTVTALLELNPLIDPDIIIPGQELLLPADAVDSGPPSVP
jgi:LysM repeat protein